LTNRTDSVQNFTKLLRRSLNKAEMPTRLREEDHFLSYLRSRGLRATAERRVLCREIFAQHGHIDAEHVHAAVRAAGHEISRATVYRNLELLVEAGLVHRVRVGRGRTVYEHLHAGQLHDHTACRTCGRLVEFVSPGIAAMLSEICRAHGFLPQGNQLQIVGECAACSRERLAATAPLPATPLEAAHV
jgi:Fur family ferric uptake transcriptional regulator